VINGLEVLEPVDDCAAASRCEWIRVGRLEVETRLVLSRVLCRFFVRNLIRKWAKHDVSFLVDHGSTF
jgi:hypothetical protein